MPPLSLIASMGTLSIPSFLNERAHVGILPSDGKKVSCRVCSLSESLSQPYLLSTDAVWLSMGRIASEIDRRLGKRVSGSALPVMD